MAYNTYMRYYVTIDQIKSIAPILIKSFIQIAGLDLEYKDDPERINKKFTVGKLIDLINKHINPEYRIQALYRTDFGWEVSTLAYSVKDKELIDVLWRAFVWSYDDRERKRQQEEKEKIWKNNDINLVDVKGGKHD